MRIDEATGTVRGFGGRREIRGHLGVAMEAIPEARAPFGYRRG
jgi:hypothetical protein